MQHLGLCRDSLDTGCTSTDLGLVGSLENAVDSQSHAVATMMKLSHGGDMEMTARCILLRLSRKD